MFQRERETPPVAWPLILLAPIRNIGGEVSVGIPDTSRSTNTTAAGKACQNVTEWQTQSVNKQMKCNKSSVSQMSLLQFLQKAKAGPFLLTSPFFLSQSLPLSLSVEGGLYLARRGLANKGCFGQNEPD